MPHVIAGIEFRSPDEVPGFDPGQLCVDYRQMRSRLSYIVEKHNEGGRSLLEIQESAPAPCYICPDRREVNISSKRIVVRDGERMETSVYSVCDPCLGAE